VDKVGTLIGRVAVTPVEEIYLMSKLKKMCIIKKKLFHSCKEDLSERHCYQLNQDSELNVQ